MKPVSLELENFECHSNSFIDFTSFNSALIVGKKKNDDRVSNGVGKSTIFRAIDYVLFKQARVNLDKLIRDDADKCKVTFSFEADGEHYKVSRSRSNKAKSGESDLELFKKVNNEWTKITKRSNSDTESELLSIIKIGAKAFRYSVHFSQKDIGLAHVSADKRKQMLKEPLQLILYSKLEKIAKSRFSETSKELEKVRGMINVLGNPSEDIKNSQEDLSKINLSISENKEKIDSLSQETSILRNKLIDLQKLISSDTSAINQKFLNVKNKKNDINKNILKYSNEISSLEEEFISFKNDFDNKNTAFDKLKEKLNNLKNKDISNVPTLEEEVKKLKEEENTLLTKKGAGEAKYKELSEILLPNSGAKCNSCKQIVTQDHIDNCLKEASTNMEKIKNVLDKIKNKILEIKSLRESKEKEINEIKSIKNEIKTLEDKIVNASDILKNKKENISNIERSLKNKKEDLKNEKLSLESILKEEADLQEKINNLSKNDTEKQIISLNEDIQNKEKEINILNNNQSILSSKVGSLSERINLKKQDEIKLKDCLNQKKDIENKVKIQEAVVKAYSSGGIPTVIIYTILNDLQIESNNLLSELRPEMELIFEIDKPDDDGQVHDTLDILYKINGKDREWDQLSGGEQFYIDIALKLGLAKVIQNRLGVNIEFLELDEVDASLDKAGIDALTDVIKKWQTKFKILVITHNDTLKSKFRYNILVENDGKNGSTAKVIDCGDV